MRFLQGARDDFARAALLGPLVQRLGARATLNWLRDADHSFRVPARSESTDAQVRSELLQSPAVGASGDPSAVARSQAGRSSAPRERRDASQEPNKIRANAAMPPGPRRSCSSHKPSSDATAGLMKVISVARDAPA